MAACPQSSRVTSTADCSLKPKKLAQHNRSISRCHFQTIDFGLNMPLIRSVTGGTITVVANLPANPHMNQSLTDSRHMPYLEPNSCVWTTFHAGKVQIAK